MKPNIIFFLIDGLRADQVYGNNRTCKTPNIDSLIQTIYKEKPSAIKGDFILTAFLTSTMGVSYKLKV